MNKRGVEQQSRRRKVLTKALLVFAMLAWFSGSAFVVYWQIRQSILNKVGLRDVRHSIGPPFYFEDIIKSGDERFRDYRYAEALSIYQDAEKSLERSIKFENESPSKDVSGLQHYHNMKTLLKVRIELTLTVIEISRAKAQE